MNEDVPRLLGVSSFFQELPGNCLYIRNEQKQYHQIERFPDSSKIGIEKKGRNYEHRIIQRSRYFWGKCI